MKPIHFSAHEVAVVMLGYSQTTGMIPPKDGREYNVNLTTEGVTITLLEPPPPPKPERHLRLVVSRR